MHNFLSAILTHVRDGHFSRSLSFIAGLSGALSALEVTLEHYRGSFGQRIMYSPVICCSLLFVAGIWGAFDLRITHRLLPLVSILLILDGSIGFVFHIRGIARKPGGWAKNLPANLIMGPPLFAPLLLGIGGVLGLVASRLLPEESSISLSISDLQLLRCSLAAAAAISVLFNGLDAFSSHYKSRFSSRSQWIPIVLSPILLIVSLWAMGSPEDSREYLIAVSGLAILSGLVGAIFHLNGTRKRPGGIHNLFYNVIYGPPPLAPLLFAASGFFGVLASQLGVQ